MTDEQEKTVAKIQPRVYLNGFPKSGLHRVLLLARCYCEPAIDGRAWAGTFAGNAWTTTWQPDEAIYSKLAQLKDGTFLRGHCGYRADIDDFLYRMGAGCVFVYRDLRDVLVSQAYHWRSADRENLSHPEKELFAELSFEETMIACLEGIQGDRYTYGSLRERWEQYAPWLDVPWVLKARFERTLREPLEFAADFVQHIYTRYAESRGHVIEMTREALLAEAKVVAPAMDDPAKRSLTFRKGVAGQWRNEFTPYVTRLFKAQLGDWLVRLGYEEGEDW